MAEDAPHAAGAATYRPAAGCDPAPRGAFVLADRTGRIRTWSREAQALTGISAAQATDRPGHTVLGPVQQDEGWFAAAVAACVATAEPSAPVPLPHTPAGRTLTLRIHPMDATTDVVLALEDTTARPAAEQQPLLAAVLDRSPVPTAAFDTDLRYVFINRALQELNRRPAEAHVGRLMVDVLLEVGFQAEQLRQLRAMADRVLRTGEPIHDAVFPVPPGRPSRAWRTTWYRLEDDEGRVLGVAVNVSDATERERAAAEARAGRERLALLAAAGRRIGTTLDLRRTCRELGDLLVPAVADRAAVVVLTSVLGRERADHHLADRAADVRVVAESTADDAATRLLPGLGPVGRTLTCPPGSALHRCLSENRPLLLPHGVLDEPTAGSPDQGRTTPAPAGNPVLLVPLHTAETPLGVVALARREGRPGFDDSDRALASELAARVAVSVDNAHLYEREHEVAQVLQRRLLPAHAAHEPGIENAHRYLPSSASPGFTGGDWLDVISLPGVRTALVVGDAMGKGVEATALMGQLRTTLRSLLALGMPADEALWNLDRQVIQTGFCELATCLVLIYDPATGRCSATTAGHPPPAIRTPDGRVTVLDLPAGAPLGVGGVPFDTVDVKLDDGTLVALYTDGLVESPTCDLTSGTDRLTEILRTHHGGVEEACDRLVAELVSEPRADDVALLLARTHTLPGDHVVSWELDDSPDAARRGRRLLRSQLDAWHLQDLSDTAELLVSEVITNAVRYGVPPIELRLLRLDRLRCEVSDRGRMLPHIRLAAPVDENGRGIHIVSMLGRRWGADRTSGGKTVWWELDLPAAPAAPTAPAAPAGGPAAPAAPAP